MKHKTEILRDLNLGGIVAEHDLLLSKCFVRHPVLTELVQDRKDVVLGAKGAGKSALWSEIRDNQPSYAPIRNVDLRLVTNPAGDPEFRDVLAAIGSDEFPEVDELRVGWRLYFLAQFWKESAELIPEKEERDRIRKLIEQYGIVPKPVTGLKAAFAFALAKARALRQLKVEWTSGLALDFDQTQLTAGGSAAAIPFNDLMIAIDAGLRRANRRVWLILDRLDEIILGDENRENLVLKGLLLSYRDVSDYANAKIKVFLRDDVYDRVTSIGHFPALTHVRSKAAGPIRWDSEDLLLLLVRRLVENRDILDLLRLDGGGELTSPRQKAIFYAMFPDKIDKGRAAEGFKWIVDRITDGNGVATPRDLLSVIDAARSFQIEQLEREATQLPGTQLFSGDSIRRAVRKVAKDNLETRIFAEYPDLRKPIEAFRGGKADHNNDTLRQILGSDFDSVLPRLQRVGFIYQRFRNGVQMWTVPFFFSFALEITRGAAFALGDDESPEPDD